MNFTEPYILWYHGVNNVKWDIKSYENIIKMNNVTEYFTAMHSINDKIFPNSMFFIMKDGIDPTWEHPVNKAGGTWSFKIDDNVLLELWDKINMLLIADNFFEEKECMNGISLAPKKGYYILKLWTNKDCKNINFSKELDSMGDKFNKSSSQYKKH